MSTRTNAEMYLFKWREWMANENKAPLFNWRLVTKGSDGDSFAHISGLYVIVSFAEERDSRVWMHLSASYKDRVPNHREMTELKNTFLGDEKYAYAIYPPKEVYVNIHPNCLHLWHCCSAEDGKILPEFSGFLGKERSI